MKTAVVFRAHYVTDAIRHTYDELLTQADGRTVFFAFDTTNALPPSLPGLFTFNDDALRSAGLFHESPWLNGDHPLILLRRKHPGFDAYWMIEYDVRCTGSWRDLFEPCESTPAGLLGSRIARFGDDRSWAHWGRSNRTFARRHWRRCFFPVIRLSGQALDMLETAYLGGVTGFCEFVVPTLVQRAGLSVADLNDVNPATWHDRTFRYRPIMKRPDPGPGLLRHPVREEREVRPAREFVAQLTDTVRRKARGARVTMTTGILDGADRRRGPHSALPGPFVVAGVGGSGTRLVADLLASMRIDMGLVRRTTRDNLWFPALFFRAMNLFTGIDQPAEEEIYRRLRLFDDVTAAEYGSTARHVWQRLRCFAFAVAQCRFYPWSVIRHNTLPSELRRVRNWRKKSVDGVIGWGFKEPIAQVFLPQLIEHYPDLRYILVVRQPLAMATNPNQWQQWFWGSVFGVQGRTEDASLEYWLRANQRNLELLHQLPAERAFVLRYEDLCNDPNRVIERLRCFVGAAPVDHGLADLVRPSSRKFETERPKIDPAALAHAENFFASLTTGFLDAR